MRMCTWAWGSSHLASQQRCDFTVPVPCNTIWLYWKTALLSKEDIYLTLFKLQSSFKARFMIKWSFWSWRSMNKLWRHNDSSKTFTEVDTCQIHGVSFHTPLTHVLECHEACPLPGKGTGGGLTLQTEQLLSESSWALLLRSVKHAVLHDR